MLRQEYEKYTEQDFYVWRTLYERQMQILPGRADSEFMQGIERVGFAAEKIPDFSDVNENLSKLTGWGIVVVPGLIDNKPFFEYLKNSLFPSSTWLRKVEQLDYLQEPDMFHDIFGHVPLLSNKDFTGFLTGLSEIALDYIENPLAIELISRLYWYTVEFGLVKTESGLKIYGAGILSSPGESVYCLESDIPKRIDFDVETIMHKPYIKDRYQAQYYVIDSYKQLYESVREVAVVLEKMLKLNPAEIEM
jgi:phenylalanine-4-hydroxylase